MLGVGRVQIEHRDLVVVLEIADPRHKVFEEHDALDEEEEAEEDDPDVLVGAVVVCGTDPVSAILVPLVAGGPDAARELQRQEAGRAVSVGRVAGVLRSYV